MFKINLKNNKQDLKKIETTTIITGYFSLF